MATKLTPEEKAAKKLAREAERAAEEQRYKEERAAYEAAYKASIPKRIKDAEKLAHNVGVAVHMELTETGPEVRFEYENHSKKIYIDRTLTYNSDEWELEDVETDLVRIKTEQDAYQARKAIAQAVFDTLSPDQKFALKEHIHYLK